MIQSILTIPVISKLLLPPLRPLVCQPVWLSRAVLALSVPGSLELRIGTVHGVYPARPRDVSRSPRLVFLGLRQRLDPK